MVYNRFLSFQYKTLKEKSPIYKAVVNKLKENSLSLDYLYSIIEKEEAINTPKDKDKDKDKVKGKDKKKNMEKDDISGFMCPKCKIGFTFHEYIDNNRKCKNCGTKIKGGSDDK